MQEEAREESLSELKSHARKAVWVFIIINICVVLLALIGNKEFVFAAIFIQFGFTLVASGLLISGAHQKACSGAIHTQSLGIYKNLMGQVQWP